MFWWGMDDGYEMGTSGLGVWLWDWEFWISLDSFSVWEMPGKLMLLEILSADDAWDDEDEDGSDIIGAKQGTYMKNDHTFGTFIVLNWAGDTPWKTDAFILQEICATSLCE